jgi:hypothetical protein
MEDWRLFNQEIFLKDQKLIYKKFEVKPDWDHEHCSFCWQRISPQHGDEPEGYCTEDESRWICKKCFEDFKASFNWTVIEPGK